MAKKAFSVFLREQRARLSVKLARQVTLKEMSEHLTDRLKADGGPSVSIHLKNLSKWELGHTKPDPETENRIRKVA